MDYKKFENIIYEKVKINEEAEMFEDRKNELKAFFGLTALEFEDKFQSLKENQLKKHNKLLDLSTDKKLIQNYKERSNNSLIGHMLNYTRYNYSIKLAHYFNSIYDLKERKKIKILDYGCSVADYGLVFALLGYSVTLCDIEEANLRFAEFRFQNRNLPYKKISINLRNMYPNINSQNIIIASEVLEHIRNPLKIVKIFYNALNINGFLWVSGYPFVTKKLEGDHLPEAVELKIKVLKYLKNNFSLLNFSEGILLQKRNVKCAV